MRVSYDLVVDFARPSKSNTIIISEGDTNSRVLHFTLLANKQVFSMSDVTVATVRGVKSDGSVVYGEAQILEDESGNLINEVEYTIPAAIADEAGNVTMTITLMSASSEQITSFEFYLQVRNALYNEDDLVTESDLSGFRDLLNRCMIAVQKIEAMTENTALPNPYALNLNIEGELYPYSGREEVNITLENMAYISETIDLLDESIDESAAGSAAESAAEAFQSANNSYLSKVAAENAATTAGNKATEAASSKTQAEQQAGYAQAYATQCQQIAEKLNLPTADGTYLLSCTMVGGLPTYTWVTQS